MALAVVMVEVISVARVRARAIVTIAMVVEEFRGRCSKSFDGLYILRGQSGDRCGGRFGVRIFGLAGALAVVALAALVVIESEARYMVSKTLSRLGQAQMPVPMTIFCFASFAGRASVVGVKRAHDYR